MYTREEINYMKTQQELILNEVILFDATREQVKNYINQLLQLNPWNIDKDVRVNILHQIESVLTSYQMNLVFSVEQVSSHQFQHLHFKTPTFKDANRVTSAYLSYNGNALLYNLSGIIERYLRIICRELDHATDISKGIYGIRKKVFDLIELPTTSDEWGALNLLTAIRNPIHNNGVYVNPSAGKADENFYYRNQAFVFVNHTPHKFATCENLNHIILDLVSLIKAINNHPIIRDKKLFIDQCLYL